MARFFSSRMGKIVAQASALAVVTGGISAFVVTQSGENEAVANNQYAAEPLEIELASATAPLNNASVGLPVSVTIAHGGNAAETYIASAGTVQEVLAELGVEHSSQDKVTPALGDAVTDGQAITVDVVETQEVLETETVKYKTEKKNDSSLDKGKTKVQTKGENGSADVTFKVTTVNGEETGREEVSRDVTKEPTTEVVLVGTKEQQPAASSNSSSNSSGGNSSGGGAPTSGVWAKLAQCESGGNPSIVSPNGLYHGLYQFSVSTWRSVGGSGLPSQASPAEQTKRAQMLQQRAGWGQWPACSRAIGVR